MYPIPEINNLPSGWNAPPFPGHRRFANWLVENMKPETIVDLGVDLGYSTFSFAEVGIGHVYGIDSFQGDEDVGPRNTEEFVHKFKNDHNLNNVTFVKGMFSEVVKTWDKHIDILHIDGLHRFHAVEEDYNNWSKFVKDTGIILFHDVIAFPGVRDFFNKVELNKLWFKESNGLGIASKDNNLIRSIQLSFPYVRTGAVT